MRSPVPLSRHLIRLREGDLAYIQAAYEALPAAHVIRSIVSAHVDDLRKRAAAGEALPPVNLDLTEIPEEPTE